MRDNLNKVESRMERRIDSTRSTYAEGGVGLNWRLPRPGWMRYHKRQNDRLARAEHMQKNGQLSGVTVGDCIQKTSLLNKGNDNTATTDAAKMARAAKNEEKDLESQATEQTPIDVVMGGGHKESRTPSHKSDRKRRKN